MKPIYLSPDAQAELEGAADWYESRHEGLGLSFVQDIDQAFQTIEKMPSTFPRWDHDNRFRRFVLRRFPYLIFYRELDDRIEVIAVAHSAREPGYWRKRT